MAPPNPFASSALAGNTSSSNAQPSNPPKPSTAQILDFITSKSSLLRKAAVHLLEQYRSFVVQDQAKASIWLMKLQSQIPRVASLEHSAFKFLTRNMDEAAEYSTLLKTLIEDLRITRKALMVVVGVPFNGFNKRWRNAGYQHEIRGFEEMVADVEKAWIQNMCGGIGLGTFGPAPVSSAFM
jgi:hypothetical protein